jgi:hypothetical protein
MHVRKLALLAALGVAGAFVACTLNPQPLPPRDNEASSFGDDASTTRSDAGSFGTDPQNPPSDAGAVPNDDSEGGVGGGGDGGDGGSDAGDGGGDAAPVGDSG